MGHIGKIGIQQDDVGRLTGRIAAGGHGDAAVGALEGQHVVDPVAGHGDGMAGGLHGQHQLALLLRLHPAEDGVLPCGRLNGRVVGEGLGVHIFLRAGDARPTGHLRHGDGVIP